MEKYLLLKTLILSSGMNKFGQIWYWICRQFSQQSEDDDDGDDGNDDDDGIGSGGLC